MDHLQRVVTQLNKLLMQHSPRTFSSAWILKRAPGCYRFIRKHIRSEVGRIDWDKITYALEPKHQGLWTPLKKRKAKPYRDRGEVGLILNKYRNKLYVFVAPADAIDLQIRDTIAVALVRVAQAGNLLAATEVVELVSYTISGWLDNCAILNSSVRRFHRERWANPWQVALPDIRPCYAAPTVRRRAAAFAMCPFPYRNTLSW
jgi:hypothetical protein